MTTKNMILMACNRKYIDEDRVIHRNPFGKEDEIAIALGERGRHGTVRINDNFYVKESDELWETAIENTINGTDIRPMESALGVIGIDEASEIYVATNDIMCCGAGIIACKKYLNDFRKNMGWNRMVIIPSSIHELLLMDADKINWIDLTDMILEINSDYVSPEQRLSNHPYVAYGDDVVVGII